MGQNAPEPAEPSAIVIVDAMQLRRASVVSLLEAWATSLDLAILSATPDTDLSTICAGRTCRMAVLNVGGLGVDEPLVQGWLDAMRLHLKGAPLVVISDREDPEEVVSAFRAGVRGFVPTTLDPSVALRAFTFIIGGGSFFPPSALLHPPLGVGLDRADRPHQNGNGLALGKDDGDGGNGGDLTIRQSEVLKHLRLGHSNKMIARALHMQESTVKVHVRQIMRKLGAANRTQAALLAETRLGQQDVDDGVTELHGEEALHPLRPCLVGNIAIARRDHQVGYSAQP